MISKSAIQQFAVRYQTTELNVRREYIQHLFLSYFYRQPKSEHFLFKGGTALRMLYRSPRFSEDLDFNAKVHDIRIIESILEDTLREMEREGIKTAIQEVKRTTGGYLAIILFSLQEYKITLQIEISFRQGKTKSETASIMNDYMPIYPLVHLAQEELVMEKMQALFSRQKPRDFYDLYFLLRANLIAPNERSLLKKVPPLFLKSDINFEKELKEFLPKSQWLVIRDFPKTLLREIKRFL